MTPLQLEFLLHCYASPTPYEKEQAGSKPLLEAQQAFIDDGIIEPAFHQNQQHYKVTSKGRAFVQMILATPYPEASYVNPLTGKTV